VGLVRLRTDASSLTEATPFSDCNALITTAGVDGKHSNATALESVSFKHKILRSRDAGKLIPARFAL
jgi:hypothetical protein